MHTAMLTKRFAVGMPVRELCERYTANMNAATQAPIMTSAIRTLFATCVRLDSGRGSTDIVMILTNVLSARAAAQFAPFRQPTYFVL
jgi:hypothetical protein